MLNNGTKLVGSFKGEHLVDGVATLPDGRVFQGQFHETSGVPRSGAQLEEDGDMYRGDFNAGWQRHGNGEAWLLDGTYYRGRFELEALVEGLVRIPQGLDEIVFQGTLKDEMFVTGCLKQREFEYVGDFEQNVPHGKGMLRFFNGAQQEGTFFRGKLHGSNCKMKLDSGSVYVGEFLDGQIRRGILHTSTFTYDGEFDEFGKAHGEGMQELLTTSPKLRFSGLWTHGALTSGTVRDEHGTPVDWQQRHDLQEEVVGADAASFNRFANAKIKEHMVRQNEAEESFHSDAKVVASASGRHPSRSDLGYERSLHEAVNDPMPVQRTSHQFSPVAESMRRVAAEKGSVCDDVLKVQQAAQHANAERAQEQWDRFRQQQKVKTPASGSGVPLNVDANQAWKGAI